MSLSSIGDRLRRERERLALSQTAMAEAAGTTRKTQFNYETDARHPDTLYLAAVAALGVDVSYVITGAQRADFESLDAEEQKLLDGFRQCPGEVRRHLLQTVALLAANSGAASGKSP